MTNELGRELTTAERIAVATGQTTIMDIVHGAQQVRNWLRRHGANVDGDGATQEDIDRAFANDWTDAHTENNERASFSQNYAWAERHNLPSGRREHIQRAIQADHDKALLENELNLWMLGF